MKQRSVSSSSSLTESNLSFWCSYVFPLVSLTLPLGVSSLPFFSQMRCGSGAPDAVQLKTALPPAGLETD